MIELSPADYILSIKTMAIGVLLFIYIFDVEMVFCVKDVHFLI